MSPLPSTRLTGGFIEGDDATELYTVANIKAYQAQQIVIEQVLEATTLLFEIGGASATSESRRFDRYWRMRARSPPRTRSFTGSAPSAITG